MAIVVDQISVDGVLGEHVRASVFVSDSSGTPTIQYANNVSSITDSGVGQFVVNFTNALPSANYNIMGIAQNDAGGAVGIVSYTRGDIAKDASSFPLRTSSTGGSATDQSWYAVVTL